MRSDLFSYLLRQNYGNLPCDVSLELSRLFFMFNDEASLSRLSLNFQFQKQLWSACSTFGEGPFGVAPLMQRIIAGYSVEIDEFDTFRMALAFFCNIARTSLIPLSDADILGMILIWLSSTLIAI